MDIERAGAPPPASGYQDFFDVHWGLPFSQGLQFLLLWRHALRRDVLRGRRYRPLISGSVPSAKISGFGRIGEGLQRNRGLVITAIYGKTARQRFCAPGQR